MAKGKEIKIPSKTTMNLYQKDTKGNNVPLFMLGLIIVVVVAFLIAQFGVIRRLNKLNAAQQEVNKVQFQLNSYQLEMTEYPTVKENYLRYSDSYSKDSVVFVDRISIINLLEDACKGLGSIASFNISGNSVTVKVRTTNLEAFDVIKTNLDADPRVTGVTPISHEDTNDRNVVYNIFRFNVKEVEE